MSNQKYEKLIKKHNEPHPKDYVSLIYPDGEIRSGRYHQREEGAVVFAILSYHECDHFVSLFDMDSINKGTNPNTEVGGVCMECGIKLKKSLKDLKEKDGMPTDEGYVRKVIERKIFIHKDFLDHLGNYYIPTLKSKLITNRLSK